MCLMILFHRYLKEGIEDRRSFIRLAFSIDPNLKVKVRCTSLEREVLKSIQPHAILELLRLKWKLVILPDRRTGMDV